MRHSDPGQNEVSGVVSQQMSVPLPGLRRPADEGISAGDGIRGGREGEAGQEPVTAKGQILEVLTHGLRVTEVMKLLDQAVEKSFLRGPADLTKFNGREFFDLIGDRVLADRNGWRSGQVPEGVVIARYSGRQRDELLPLQDEQKTAADHVLQLAISLPPAPRMADFAGDGRAAFSIMVGDDLLEEGDIVWCDATIAIGQD